MAAQADRTCSGRRPFRSTASPVLRALAAPAQTQAPPADGAGAPGSPESGRPPRRSCLFCARLPDLPATGKIGSFCSVNRELCHCNARPWGRPAQPPNLGYLRLVAWGLARAQVCSIQVGLEICQVACSILDGAFVKSPGLARYFFFGKHIYRLRTPLTANDPD